jgi:hypothetical protein
VKLFNLIRDVGTAHETCGWLSIGERKWATIERPWVPSLLTQAGVKGISCVPFGRYRLESHDTEAHPKVWALVNRELDVYHWPWEVPVARQAFARTAVLIHPANWAAELRGCIAPGLRRGIDGQRWRTYESRDAVNQIRSAIGASSDAWLEIR